MDDAVPIRRYNYPTIIRVILDRSSYYHVAIIVSSKEYGGFSANDIWSVCKITDLEQWKNTRFRDWPAARAELARQLALYPDEEMKDEQFITLRPRHNEMTITNEVACEDHLARSEKARAGR
jgi:hypothetical protein